MIRGVNLQNSTFRKVCEPLCCSRWATASWLVVVTDDLIRTKGVQVKAFFKWSNAGLFLFIFVLLNNNFTENLYTSARFKLEQSEWSLTTILALWFTSSILGGHPLPWVPIWGGCASPRRRFRWAGRCSRASASTSPSPPSRSRSSTPCPSTLSSFLSRREWRFYRPLLWRCKRRCLWRLSRRFQSRRRRWRLERRRHFWRRRDQGRRFPPQRLLRKLPCLIEQ